MTTYYGALLDTVSIQSYIFQSNELRENIGASYIIENLVYGDYLKEAIERALPSYQIDINLWKTSPDRINICFEPVEIGYIGGGNALILFQEEEKANEFIRQWTRILMVKAPQVVAAVALDEFNLENFQESKKHLFLQLQKNKMQFAPQTVISSHGITAECSRTGLSQNLWNKVVKEYISCVSHAKIEAGKEARDNINNRYKDIILDNFTFTNELDKLGQIKGEDSHIAIVHIDGNDIGELFSDPSISSLPAIREISIKIDEITNSAFKSLLSLIIKNYCKIMERLGFDNYSNKSERLYPIDKEDKEKIIIPIRPIILSGDDVTFVCDGKLGIYFAEKYLLFFENEAKNRELNLTACAGVAIIKSKYPFFRGYRLAEELCGNAKKIRKAEMEGFSYLDFHIASGSISNSLENIRQIHFTTPHGRLYCRPYRMDWTNGTDERSFSLLVQNAKKLKNDLPKNKISELREALTQSESARDRFLVDLKVRDKKLPAISKKYFENKLFDSIVDKLTDKEPDATPYLDMIELTKYYPFLANEES